MNDLTRALYEAHVAHELARLTEGPSSAAVERVFEWLSSVSLDEILTREQVLDVIDRYVIDLRISGGITELMGQLSQTIFTSDASTDTRIDQLLSYELYRGFADKIQSLDGAFRELLQLISHTRSLQPMVARTIVLAARSVLFERRDKRARGEPTGVLEQLGRELRTELAERLERQLQSYLESHTDVLASASEASLRKLIAPDTLRSLADELWDAVSTMRLAELFSLLSPTDVEDFVVLGYETWLHYRHTPYFRAVCEQGLAAFFAKYGSESMQGVLEDMGVDASMVTNELRALLLPALAQAARTGFLEQQVRARLEPFYRSEAAASLLARAPLPALQEP